MTLKEFAEQNNISLNLAKQWKYRGKIIAVDGELQFADKGTEVTPRVTGVTSTEKGTERVTDEGTPVTLLEKVTEVTPKVTELQSAAVTHTKAHSLIAPSVAGCFPSFDLPEPAQRQAIANGVQQFSGECPACQILRAQLNRLEKHVADLEARIAELDMTIADLVQNHAPRSTTGKVKLSYGQHAVGRVVKDEYSQE